MLDLSNNNSAGHDFKTAYVKGGQRRLYLKCVEGVGFVDGTFADLKRRAQAAGFHVGGYDFLHPLASSPAEAAAYFVARLGKVRAGHELRPCLDCEYGSATAAAGRWITETAGHVYEATGVKPLIYGSGYWLQDCHFPAAPGPLWLAAYGRDDGREYPVGMIPKPWTTVAAHQFSSKATVVGIHGLCDLSHVYVPGSVEVPKGAGRA